MTETVPEEDQRDAFGRAVNPVSRKRDRSPSSSSDSSDSSDNENAPKPQEAASSPPRKKRVREMQQSSRSRSNSRPIQRERERDRERERPPRRREAPTRRSNDRRSRSRSPPPQKRRKPKSFKEFIMKLPDDISPDKAQDEYKKYLNQFDKSREAIFFTEHKEESWFQEKYDPLIIEEQNRARANYSIEEAKAFVSDFLEGKLKDIINKDCKDEARVLPSWTATEDNEGNISDKNDMDVDASDSRTGENDETDTAKDALNVPESMEVEVPSISTVEQVEGENPLGEDPPIKAENTKENDDSKDVLPGETVPDGEGEPDAEDTSPPGTSMKKPGESRPEAQEFRGPQSDGYRGDRKGNRGFSEVRDCHDNQVFIQGIPLATTRDELEEVFKTVDGFIQLFLADPSRGDRRTLNGWAQFKTQEDAQKVMNEEAQGGLNGKRITAAYYLTLFPKRPPRQRVHYVHQVFLHPERVTHDFNQAIDLIRHFDKQNGVHEHNLFSPETLDPMTSDLHRLNLCLEYLRRVHFVGYYQTRRFKTLGELQAKQPQKIVRNRGDYSRGTKPEPFDVENDVDEFVKFEMSNPENDVHEKTWNERKRIKLATENTKEVKAGSKYRCALCLKAFKGAKYVQKHILLKHKPIVIMYLGKQREKEMLQNYSNDKHKITAQWFRPDDRPQRRRFNHNPRFQNNRGDRSFHHRRPPNLPSNKFSDPTMDAPPPHKFDHTGPVMLKTADKIRTVRNYEDIGDDLGIDDLLDFGFGDFQQAPKFNL